MPEMPEVFTIVEDLKKYVIGAEIEDIMVLGDYNALPDNQTFISGAIGQKIIGARRIAKNIILELENGNSIQIHLAMTGNFLLRQEGHAKDKFTRVVLKMNKKDKRFELRFADMRMFGKAVLQEPADIKLLEEKYGPEPLDETTTAEIFLKQIKSKNTNIKNVLLDQSKIAGMGNVYVTDALWIAKIHPETRTIDFDIEMAEALLEASKEILSEGIKNRGISMSDYVDLFGKKGRQQEAFRIYNHEKCPRCEISVEFKKLNGRGTYFCANCQLKGTAKGKLL